MFIVNIIFECLKCSRAPLKFIEPWRLFSDFITEGDSDHAEFTQSRFYHHNKSQIDTLFMDYTGCTLKLRAVKLLFVIFGRLSYSFFVQIMVSGNGRLSYIL